VAGAEGKILMLSGILAFFQAIPAITGGINNFVNKYYDAKAQMYAARVGGDVDAGKAMLAAEVATNQAKVGWLQAISSSPVLSFVVVGFAFPFIFYLNKVIVYDICLGLGSTPILKYELLTNWGGVIIGGIFLTTGAVGSVQAWINRK
jgi:hypothetical protein